MKKLFFMTVCLTISTSWGQINPNKSRGAVVGTTDAMTGALSPILPAAPALSTNNNVEAFRFPSGLVTQLDSGSDFVFGASNQWWSLGKLTVGTQFKRTLYGLRLQRAGQAITMGYAGAEQAGTTPTAGGNPFIEWISGNAATNNLQFFTATDPALPASRRLSLTLRSDLTALFGETSLVVLNELANEDGGNVVNQPKVEINANGRQGLNVTTSNKIIGSSFINNGGGTTGTLILNDTKSVGLYSASVNATDNTGIYTIASGGLARNTGVIGVVEGSSTSAVNTGFQAVVTSQLNKSNNYGLFSRVAGGVIAGSINCGVYATATGFAAVTTATQASTLGTYAGYFAGLLYSSSSFTVSDSALKSNVTPEKSNIEKLSQLNPVTYNYIENKDGLKLNLPSELQHGLVAQELEKVYPEMVKNLLHPLFNDKNEQIGTKAFKAVNYNGLISVMIASMKEMSAKIINLEDRLSIKERPIVLNSNKNLTKNEIENITANGYFLGQNTPNPFKNSTVIEYSLPTNEKNASILIFNLNGQTIKEYKLNDSKGNITIDDNVLSKGLYLYSLISNGQEIATKKMLMN